jgi:hypothetical protein
MMRSPGCEPGRAAGDTILNVRLRGEMEGFTLAVNLELGTISLLHSWRASPWMLQEQQFAAEELDFLPPLLRVYPEHLTVQPPTVHPSVVEVLWQKVEALSCEVSILGGCALHPKNRFTSTPPEMAEELVRFSPRGLLPENAALVANQRLCTLSLITVEGTTARMTQQCLFTTNQMAILLHLLVVHPDPVSQGAIYPDFLVADAPYGGTRQDPDALARMVHEELPPMPSREELALAEELVWQDISNALPLLRRLGMVITREVSYHLTEILVGAPGNSG